MYVFVFIINTDNLHAKLSVKPTQHAIPKLLQQNAAQKDNNGNDK